MKSIHNKHKKQKKYWLLGALVVLFLLAGLVSIAIATNSWPFAKSNSGSDNPSQSINYGPPTDEEIESSQDGKRNSTNDNKAEETDGIRQVGVEVSYAKRVGSNLEIRAFTPDVIESDGTCTATVTNGSQEVTETSKGFVDASSTICEPINIPLSALNSTGVWTVVVSYASSSSAGTSTEVEAEL
ncbi:hypothetical protein CL689_01090 [Candidatus Saccharibacteria bacterium]|nr:hypothetical protein [Candidatus Saccharibacteria bacterium]MBQ68645.1 hypothetical protein [Candidatus Saccharibacteria bacterium]